MSVTLNIPQALALVIEILLEVQDARVTNRETITVSDIGTRLADALAEAESDLAKAEGDG